MPRRKASSDRDDVVKSPRMERTQTRSAAVSDHRHNRTTGMNQSRAENFVHPMFTNSAGQIRLLEMLPEGGDDEQALRFSISVQSLHEALNFNAISYTWGDVTKKRSILINDDVFYVHWNCWQALTQTYHQWKQGLLQSRFVWVDSVCINQRNEAEKSFQVSIMGDIYEKATHVLACIGSRSGDSEFFLAKAKATGGFKYPCDHDDFLCSECRMPWEEWALSLGISDLERVCNACVKFGQRPYWSRVWIIQEVARANSLSILCSSDMISWTSLSNLEQFLAMELDEIESVLTKYKQLPDIGMPPMHDVFATKGAPIDLDRVFSVYSKSQCTDPRDHLYGLLSLINWPKGMEPIFPNYGKSALNLALEVVPYISFQTIPEMLLGLQITANDGDVAKLIEQRRNTDFPAGPSASPDCERTFKWLHGDDSMKETLCGRIDMDQDGNMTAALTRYFGRSGALPESSVWDSIHPFRDDSEETSEESDGSLSDSAESAHEVIASWSSTFPERKPKELMADLDVAGFVCSAASPGDILVPWSSDDQELLLVLRQSHGQLYDIIGQGVLMHGYSFEHSFARRHKLAVSGLSWAQIELRISAEDALVLSVQDVDGLDDERDEDARWARLFTSVTENPSRAARVTMRSLQADTDEARSRKDIDNSELTLADIVNFAKDADDADKVAGGA